MGIKYQFRSGSPLFSLILHPFSNNHKTVSRSPITPIYYMNISTCIILFENTYTCMCLWTKCTTLVLAFCEECIKIIMYTCTYVLERCVFCLISTEIRCWSFVTMKIHFVSISKSGFISAVSPCMNICILWN